MEVDIISRELVKPSTPTPLELKDYRLSFIDEKIPPFFIPLILYFTCSEVTEMNQFEMINQLKRSLADILIEFYPLAGRIKGQVSVDCNDEGVYYLVAQVDGKLQDLVESPETQNLDKLIPYKSHGSASMADEQLAIQVNLFKCGGIAIGLCMSHRIGDGCSLCTFIKAWSGKTFENSQCQARETYNSDRIGRKSAPSGKSDMVHPIFNLATVFPPRGTPDFKPNTKAAAVQPAEERLAAKRFIFTTSALAQMKSEMVKKSSVLLPSRVELVSALLWKTCIAAKGLDKRGVSAACHPVNLRRKMVPQLLEYSFGNIFQAATALANDETDWVNLVVKLRAAINKIDTHYVQRLLSENGFKLHKNNFKEMSLLISEGNAHVIRYSNWCNFGLYEADFGWGKPVWVSSAGYASKDVIYLFDTKCPGEVEAWVVMEDQEMARLEQDAELKVFTSNYTG